MAKSAGLLNDYSEISHERVTVFAHHDRTPLVVPSSHDSLGAVPGGDTGHLDATRINLKLKDYQRLTQIIFEACQRQAVPSPSVYAYQLRCFPATNDVHGHRI